MWEYLFVPIHNLNIPAGNSSKALPFLFALNLHLHANPVFSDTYNHQSYYMKLHFVVLTNTAKCSIILLLCL